MTERTRRADELYAERRNAERVRESVRLLLETSEPLEFETLWRLGRALFFLGQESSENKEPGNKESLALHHRAVRYCRRAVGLKADRVEGHFWLGVNLALAAQSSGRFRALFLALGAMRSLRRAASINPAHHGAGPLRVLARLEAHLPRALGGGRESARKHFIQALSLAPANTVTGIYYAEMLLEAGARDEARRVLRAVLDTPTDPAWSFEAERDKRLAQRMLREIGMLSENN